MTLYFTFVSFIFGTVFGSFFNVVGWRLPAGLSLIKPRGSFCPKCKHELKWYELIPIISFLIQGGKCRACKTKISRFYISIEFLTGCLFALSYWLFGFTFEFGLAILTASFFVIVVVSDSNYLVIPDEVTVFFTIAVLLWRLICLGWSNALEFVIYGAIAFAIMLVIMIIGNYIFKKESLGGGDIKLMVYIGCAVGPYLGLFSIFLASFFALPLSLILFFRSKDSIIPFGPFLLLACLVIILFQIDLSILFMM